MVKAKIVLRQKHTYKYDHVKSPDMSLFAGSAMLGGAKNIGSRLKKVNRIEKKYLTMIEQIAVHGIDEELRLTLTGEVFPNMERDMKENIKKMESGGGGYGAPGLFSRSKDSVYNSFSYTKKGAAKKSTGPVKFKNTSLHINPLIHGVKPRTGAWFVDDWVRKMASTGKLKSKALINRKPYPTFIMGIGETWRRQNTDKFKAEKKAESRLSNLELRSRYKGKAKDLQQARKKLKSLQSGAEGKKLDAGPKKSALVKGKSKRDFWSPVVKDYFGQLPGLPETTLSSTKKSGGSEVVKYLSNGMIRRLKKNLKEIKSIKRPNKI